MKKKAILWLSFSLKAASRFLAPQILYHGTTPKSAESILKTGLKPCGRKIDKDATKLIVTPKVEFEVLGEDGHRIIGPSILKSDEKEVLDYLKQKGTLPKEVFLDDIVIDLK